MTEQLSFAADAAIITRLGSELVAKQETALIELIKNGFDADATEVEVVFQGYWPRAALEVRDNGSGMTRDELVDGFLRLASDLKVQTPRSPRFKRQRAGRKGIGRFATHRLGTRLILTTRVAGGASGLKLTVDWNEFVSGRPLQDVTVDLEDAPGGPQGTTIRIESLRDHWSESQIKRCWRGVLALQQPFPVAPVAERPGADPGFSVRFLRDNGAFRDETAVANLKTEILDHLHAIIELHVNAEGEAKWRISRNRLGATSDWTPIHHAHRDAVSPPPYEQLKSTWMKAHYAILSPELLPSLVYTRVRDVLADQGGIRLYRNGFRVIPYGDPGDDWLRLDEIYTRRSVLAPLANRNFFGVIEVLDPEGSLFNEHTSREGLIETPAFLELRDVASSVLVTAALRISEERGRKARAGTPPRPKPAEPDLQGVNAAVRAAQEAAARASQERDAAAAQAAADRAAEAARLLQARIDDLRVARTQFADEAAMLRFLATLGMTTAEFSHETGMTFDAFRLDFEKVFEVALRTNGEDESFSEQADRARAMLDRLDTLTSYLNGLAAARSARGMSAQSLSKSVEDFERGVSAQAASQSIRLQVLTPPFDPLFTRPLHRAEIASVLLNFYTNAVKAMKRAQGERLIRIEAERVDHESVRILFADTGDGVVEQDRDRIFDAFFTTRAAPPAGASDAEHASGTGLGLWIVSQIAENAGGEVAVIEPPEGYSTCFELILPAETDDGD